MEDEGQEVPVLPFGINGVNNMFLNTFCEQDQLIRRQLMIWTDKKMTGFRYTFDECNNAFYKPDPVQRTDILENLHRYDHF
mmetsp:Transcript_17961/g.30559  ORF Transcript_17961/g.30559 Transcript_17961/m.30559 type:complete len:81 (+) Transcript_17961:39-281(+)